MQVQVSVNLSYAYTEPESQPALSDCMRRLWLNYITHHHSHSQVHKAPSGKRNIRFSKYRHLHLR